MRTNVNKAIEQLEAGTVGKAEDFIFLAESAGEIDERQAEQATAALGDPEKAIGILCRLPTQHTQGPVKYWHSGYANTPFVVFRGVQFENDCPRLDKHGHLDMRGLTKICEVYHDESDEHEEQIANVKIICEAFNVATETGLTPKQLVHEAKELRRDIANGVARETKLEKINAELLAAAQYLETAARRFAEGHDKEPAYVLKMCTAMQAAIAKAGAQS